jgi:hypothetical protein
MMPVFGFVLTLGGESECRSACLQELAREPGLVLGAPQGARLPVVLEIEPGEHQEDRISRWMLLPAVIHVDYAFADFEDLLGVARTQGDKP